MADKDQSDAAPIDNAQLKKLLEQLGAQSLIDGPTSKLRREEEADKTAKHEFWETQPVPKSSEEVKEDGPLHPPLKPEQVPKDPYPLPPSLSWCLVDIEEEEQMQEMHDLLRDHYVEDVDSKFRFNYSTDFLRWALLPPNVRKDWHIGVRDTATGALVAFISGIPVDVMVRDKTITMAEINFLCVHKGLRSQRLAPLLIKEVTRHVHQVGIFQAVYTAGRQLPKPVSTCRYFHRSLNPRKLMDAGFSKKVTGRELAKLLSILRLPPQTSTPGLRPMRKGDVSQVRKLLNRYLKNRCEVLPIFKTDAEVAHWFMPRDDVIWTYVVDDAEHPGKLSDFFSFYSLPSSVLRSEKNGSTTVRGTIKPVYLYYYGTKTDYEVKLTDEEKAVCTGQKQQKALAKQKQNELIKGRLVQLMQDMLVLAKAAGFDVVNCLHMMDNREFLEEVGFGPGDGFLRYYFYNWRARAFDPSKIGLVML
ncbi:glycylpeptide N-tetradecanoyltransferase [Linderina macrospora]|uniref:Glycylpeptide N-tetradecanoyltransferase n=1 Tax=Linderina macrospora TaxID=4868 RepID=A0ACC1JDY4_9FUNG|nr:glycylpeptide N-tetradecanoyltransferase [Linderina macrospora]